MQDNKPHLLYMTGLSIDKNRMNNITENINFDKDFTYWLKDTQNEFNSVFNPNNQKLGKSIELTNKLLKKQIDDKYLPKSNFKENNTIMTT
jgi:hypothetical protein